MAPLRIALIDCYTDEPAGLGVMPTVGTYPRYLFGAALLAGAEPRYLTIDDLRVAVRQPRPLEEQVQTNIRMRNTTHTGADTHAILSSSDVVFVIAGVHTPGTYLSAYPGTTKEVSSLLDTLGVRAPRILSGPAATVGSGQWGGTRARASSRDRDSFDLLVPDGAAALGPFLDGTLDPDDPPGHLSYAQVAPCAVAGAAIVSQLPHRPSFLVAEVETMRGCAKDGACSFCTEQLKHPIVDRRPPRDIVDEVRALSSHGLRNVRLGKQSCIYSYGSAELLSSLFSALRPLCDVLHIDNVNPLFVTPEKTKALVAGCTEGNVASLGVESFDEVVIDKNNLGTTPEDVLEAIRVINTHGAARGPNGMPLFLPGINLLFGLAGESKRTHEENMRWLAAISAEGLLLRRINIREVVVFPGTALSRTAGVKYLRKNRQRYWKWRNAVRQEIDAPMLARLVPAGTVLRNLRTEIYDGNTTFARQVGTYPLVVGIPGRHGLDRFVDAEVTGHMLRSVVGRLLHP